MYDKVKLIFLSVSSLLVSLFFLCGIFSSQLFAKIYILLYLLLFFGYNLSLIFRHGLGTGSYLDLGAMLYYTVSFDLVFLIYIGLLTNFLLGLFISKPLAKYPLLLIFTFISLLFVYFSLKYNLYTISFLDFLNTKKIVRCNLNFVLACLLLPFISYIGDYFLNYLNCNLVLLFLFLYILAIFIIALHLNDFSLYVVSLYFISLSMLYFRSFSNLTNTGEKYMPSLVPILGKWIPNLPAGHNMLLPNVILHPIFIIISNFPPLYELATVHPLIISLIPVSIFSLYNKLFRDYKISYILSFLYVSMFPFFKLMAVRLRSPMAIFFFLGVVLSWYFVNRRVYRAILVIIFSSMLICSHYGIAFIVILVFIVSYTIRFISKYSLNLNINNNMNLNFNYLLFFVIMSFWWYIFVADGKRYIDIVRFFHRFVLNLLKLNFSRSYTLYAVETNFSLTVNIVKYLNMFIVFFSVIGLFIYLRYIRKGIQMYSYSFFVISFSGLLVLFSTLLPVRIFNTARVMEFSYIFILPIFYLGIKSMFSNYKKLLVFLCIFSCLYFMFNCGFISEVVTKDYAPYTYIDKPSILESSNIYYKIYLYRMYSPYFDILASSWFTCKISRNSIVYCDFFTLEKDLRYRNDYLPEYDILPSSPNKPRVKLIIPNCSYWKNTYIFLTDHNIKFNFVVFHWNPVGWGYLSCDTLLIKTLKHGSTIYNSNYDKVYFVNYG